MNVLPVARSVREPISASLLILALLAAAAGGAWALRQGDWVAAALSAATMLTLGGLLLRERAARRARRPAPDPRLGPLAALNPLLEALPDPALLIDRDGRIAGSNAAARRNLQFEASGLFLSAILRQPELLDAAQAASEDGAPGVVEYENTAPVEEHIRAYVAPLAWGDARGALIAFHDQSQSIITERARADFLANASHELKTPLASLLLLIETIGGAARDDPEARDRFLDMMKAQAGRMSRLIEDLLSLSRIELNERVPPTERADLVAIAREAIDALAPTAMERKVIMALDAPAEGLMVVGDRFQLGQVAQNLVDNALRYSPAGKTVRIEVGFAQNREAAAAAAGRRWEEAARVALLTAPPGVERPFAFLRVTDEGPGIARRHLPRLSERFYRTEREESAGRSGTGLGLAIVRHIMSRHRGGFLVESTVGAGSAFAIYLDMAQS